MKKYGNTSEERDVLESARCREIVSEILSFGVNQTQILTLIKLLSLELEDRELMLQINEALNTEALIDKPTITI